ncbi:MAG TPA: hypothetical protein VF320_10480 [Acidimicrobiales bacterium]
MILATFDSTPYRILLILHILFVVVAFGGLFAAPMLARAQGASTAVASGMVGYLQRIAVPAIILAGLMGFGLIGMSKVGDKAKFEFSQSWVGIAMLLWLLEIGLLLGLLIPTERKVAAGDAEAAKRLPMFTGLSHLILLVAVGLMVFKPGA